jgi:cytochrome b561
LTAVNATRRSAGYGGQQENGMTRHNASGRYSTASIALHWLMLLLFVAVYATIELREVFPKGSGPREALKAWHFMLGLSVFVLVWIRIAARLLWPSPAPLDEPAWRSLAATAAHLALYALMIGMPLAGWIILSAEGDPVPFFGLALPALTGPDAALAERVEELHELGGTIGYWLIGLHAAASLFHHYVLRDRLMDRMRPGRA